MRRDAGFTLIEILVTIVVLALGLLGVAGMQARASVTEFESYQRGQALALVRDMQSRLLSSRGVLPGYLDKSVSASDGSVYFGSGAGATSFADGAGNCPAPVAGDALAIAKHQVCTWAQELLGASVKEGANAIGAMVGARGCLVPVVPPQQNALADVYVVVVWQGVEARAEPAAASAIARCASAVNFGQGLRRGISLRVMVPDLQKGA
ncbi:MAG TPA: type IV pilus modification protein PilV [Burkholderiaceae bacterium]|nr:type IV pilus modification protein PilV [Burkholderiaceae bacterium]